MVDKSRRFKLEYEDASTGTETIAETDQDTGALQIDRFVHIRRTNDPDILKVWLEGDNFGDSIPTQLSDFATAQNGENEPEILLKQYDPNTSGFVTQGRFYAKNSGTINEEGQLALKLYSFMKFTADQSVDTGTISTDIEAALNAVLPSGYVADVPGTVTPPGISNYSLNTRREKGYRELTRDYRYSLRFTSELDGSNNYLVKYEPVGQGGTVDTISQDDVTDGNDAVRFKSWQKNKTESIVNKVTVEGVDSNGNKVTGTATNTTQINNFGEKFRKYKVGYIESTSEAEEIAENYLVPGLDSGGNDITKVPESGTLKTEVYSDSVVNDSFAIIDNQRSINDTYTCVQQRNYWPEGATELEFEFEQEGLEKEARKSEDLRDERSRLYPNSTTDVGGQTVDANTENVTDSYDEQNDPTHEHNVAGETSDPSAVDTEYNTGYTDGNINSGGDAAFIDTTLDFVTGDTDYTVITVSAQIINESSSVNGWNLSIANLDTSTTYVSIVDWIPGDAIMANSAGDFAPVTKVSTFVVDGDIEGDEIRTTLTNFSDASTDFTLSVSYAQVAEHDHSIPFVIDRAQSESTGNTNATNPADTSADDTTSLNATGSTDAKNINVATEDDTSR